MIGKNLGYNYSFNREYKPKPYIFQPGAKTCGSKNQEQTNSETIGGNANGKSRIVLISCFAHISVLANT